MEQSWNAELYAKNARFVSDLGAPLVDLLSPRRGERVLDLGCGDGALTERLVALGCEVVGADASPEQVAAACARGLDARLIDGHHLEFREEFDAVFSNATLHWLRRPDAVIDGVWRALRPGGRFVAEFGGHGCVDTICRALVDALDRRGIDGESRIPWYFPTTEDYAERLSRRGFDVSYIALFPRPTPLPGDITGWLDTFAESFTRALLPEDRASFIADVCERLRPSLADDAGRWTADYVRLRFASTKPSPP
jgi:trans-aconitate methyltransferase